MTVTYQIGEHTYQANDAGLFFPRGVDHEVMKILTELEGTGENVRLFYGDVDGTVWPQDEDVYGKLQRTIGPCKVVKLALGDKVCDILPLAIVGILRYRGWAYMHPNVKLGLWTLRQGPYSQPYEVCYNGSCHRRFDGRAEAFEYMEFMTGERMEQ